MTTVINLFLTVFINTVAVALMGGMLWDIAERKKPSKIVRALLLIPPIGIATFFGVCLYFCFKFLVDVGTDYFKN